MGALMLTIIILVSWLVISSVYIWLLYEGNKTENLGFTKGQWILQFFFAPYVIIDLILPSVINKLVKLIDKIGKKEKK